MVTGDEYQEGDPGSTPRGANFNERDAKAAVTNPLNIRYTPVLARLERGCAVVGARLCRGWSMVGVQLERGCAVVGVW